MSDPETHIDGEESVVQPVPEEEIGTIGVPKHILDSINDAPAGIAILSTCIDLAYFLSEKNRSYGNSALSPINIFSKTTNAQEQILVRMDDKLNRLLKGNEYADEDTLKDLLGYLLLYFVAKDNNL